MKMFWKLTLAMVVLALCLVNSAAAATPGELHVYFIDVEGGQSTLFVAPTGESLLIDTGWDGNKGRDADRIVATAKKAGLKRIDYVLLTHYHDDHTGGVPQLAARFPIGTFVDHGPNRETNNLGTVKTYAAYQQVLAEGKSKHMTLAPGDTLPIHGFNVTVISADGNLIDHPVPGGGEKNQFCAISETRPADQTENARSLGVLITFGQFRILDLGDLTWDKEMQLMCPVNPIGRVDVLVVSHHGWYQSSSPALVYALHAHEMVMDNGENKGGSTPTFKTLKGAPDLQHLWQLHYSAEAGALNTPEKYIANPKGTDAGNGLELTAWKNGNVVITNPRDGISAMTKHELLP